VIERLTARARRADEDLQLRLDRRLTDVFLQPARADGPLAVPLMMRSAVT